ncbi:hypothetical protein B0H10DRAFT_1958012 [Mycena sp. CBHHK59/15]|nr:hypothetical protein B0H10DRAFT_1958012 [Mycena sp. CBHHK59/15]
MITSSVSSRIWSCRSQAWLSRNGRGKWRPGKLMQASRTLQAAGPAQDNASCAEEAKEEMDLDALEGLVMHPTEMVSMGLQLEELQQTLAFDLVGIGNHLSTEQLTTMTVRTNKLRHKLLSWMDIQLEFMPHVVLLRAEEDRAWRRIAATQPQPGIQVQHMVLWLPSAIQGREECDVVLYEYEYHLREGQAYEVLEGVRQQLLLRTHQYKQKDQYARGVKANTHAQTKIKRLDEHIRRTAERYRAAWRALMGLGKVLERLEWEKTLMPLAAEDVRGMPRALFADRSGRRTYRRRGQRRIGGQWTKGRGQAKDVGIEAVEEGNNPAMSEVGKSESNSITLGRGGRPTGEEMRCITQFQKWRAEWWDNLAGKRPPPPLNAADECGDIVYALDSRTYQEGNGAYARKQADIQRKLSAQFQDEWKDVADFISMGRTALGILPQRRSTAR